MRIDDQERAAVRKVLERLGDEATPPPAFEQLRLSPTTARPHAERVVAAVLVALVAVAGLGFAAQWVRTDPPIDTATLDSEEASIATPSAQPTSEASQVMPSGFRPPRFEVDDDLVVFPVTLLDGSRVALWLPDRFPFDPETYVQSAGLEAADAALPGIRVDVENCVGCRQGHTMQVGPWQIVASGDELTDEVWDQYSNLIETFPTEDGYLRLGGEVTVTPVDSPDVVLQDEGLRVRVFARECAGDPSRTQTERGFLASDLEAAEATGLCATDDRLEVWLPDSMSDSELDAVLFELVEFGPLTRGRRGFDSAGPVRNGEVIVTSGGFREDRLVGYDGSTTQPVWQRTTGAGTAFILGATIDTVVVGGQKGPVQGIRFLDGSTVWQIEMEEGESPGNAWIGATSDLFLPSSFSREGATDAPQVRAIDVSTGSVLWTTPLSIGTDLVGARPTVTDSLVLVADTVSHPGSASATSVHALDRRNGEVTWLFDLETGEQGFHTQETATDDDSAYVTSGAGTVFAIDLDTGTERWRATGVSAFDEQLQLRDGVLVSGRYCLDITNGVRTGCPSPTRPGEITAVTEYLEKARFSVILTTRCLDEAGFVTSAPWASPDTFGYQFAFEPDQSGTTRSEAVERCSRRFGIDAPENASTIGLVRTELLVEQGVFVKCFDRIAGTDNQIGSPGLGSSVAVSSEVIEANVAAEPGAVRECGARSSDGASWLAQHDLRSDQAIARLIIPAIDVDLRVHEGIDAATLRDPVAGHYLSTELPGQAGNAALAAHRTTYGAPFLRLDELMPGDSVFITTFQGVFEYQVTGQSIHEPDDVEILNDFADNRLTLTAGHPQYSNRQRIVVVGELVGEPAPGLSYIEFRTMIREDTETSMAQSETIFEEPRQPVTRATLIDRLHREASGVYAGFSAEFGVEVFLVGEGSLAAEAAIRDAQQAGLDVSVTYGMERSLDQLLTQQHELGEALNSAGFTDFAIALEVSTGQLLATIGSTPDERERELPTAAEASNVSIEFIPGTAGGLDS